MLSLIKSWRDMHLSCKFCFLLEFCIMLNYFMNILILPLNLLISEIYISNQWNLILFILFIIFIIKKWYIHIIFEFFVIIFLSLILLRFLTSRRQANYLILIVFPEFNWKWKLIGKVPSKSPTSQSLIKFTNRPLKTSSKFLSELFLIYCVNAIDNDNCQNEENNRNERNLECW